MNQLDKLEDLKADHAEKIQAFLEHRGVGHLLDAYDCADTKDH